MRYLAILALTLPLQGCWFFFFPIPTHLFQSGNTCVAEQHAKVGQRINRNDGKSGLIKEVLGADQRCRGQPGRPILVEVGFE